MTHRLLISCLLASCCAPGCASLLGYDEERELRGEANLSNDGGTSGSPSGTGGTPPDDPPVDNPGGSEGDSPAGARCDKTEECDVNLYCRKDGGTCEEEGVCTPMPTFCEESLSVVCGCDGIEYPNTCRAHRSGATVASDGPCDSNCVDSDSCSCTSNAECGTGQWCSKPLHDCDGIGRCRNRPTECAPPFEPVCTCEEGEAGQEKGNSCFAAGEGLNVAYQGRCRVQ